MIRFFIFTGMLLLLGCSSRSASKMDFASYPALAAPNASESGELKEYRLGYGDVVEIKFFNNARFNETIKVRPDGRISLEKVGELYVAGMTPAQLDSFITARYDEFLREAEVTVIVREFGGYQVYVFGEVTRPGGLPLQRNMTVLQAIAVAGGISNMAALGSVMVLRKGEDNTVVPLKLDLRRTVNAPGKEQFVNNDIEIQPNDVIYIPKTGLGSTVTFLEQVYAGVYPPLDLILRSIYVADVINRLY